VTFFPRRSFGQRAGGSTGPRAHNIRFSASGALTMIMAMRGRLRPYLLDRLQELNDLVLALRHPLLPHPDAKHGRRALRGLPHVSGMGSVMPALGRPAHFAIFSEPSGAPWSRSFIEAAAGAVLGAAAVAMLATVAAPFAFAVLPAGAVADALPVPAGSEPVEEAVLPHATSVAQSAGVTARESQRNRPSISGTPFVVCGARAASSVHDARRLASLISMDELRQARLARLRRFVEEFDSRKRARSWPARRG
jgi:hypothetical protein